MSNRRSNRNTSESVPEEDASLNANTSSAPDTSVDPHLTTQMSNLSTNATNVSPNSMAQSTSSTEGARSQVVTLSAPLPSTLNATVQHYNVVTQQSIVRFDKMTHERICKVEQFLRASQQTFPLDQLMDQTDQKFVDRDIKKAAPDFEHTWRSLPSIELCEMLKRVYPPERYNDRATLPGRIALLPELFRTVDVTKITTVHTILKTLDEKFAPEFRCHSEQHQHVKLLIKHMIDPNRSNSHATAMQELMREAAPATIDEFISAYQDKANDAHTAIKMARPFMAGPTSNHRSAPSKEFVPRISGNKRSFEPATETAKKGDGPLCNGCGRKHPGVCTL